MEDFKCIIDTSLISESEKIKEDLFKGPSLNILILLLKGEKTASEISRNLNIPIFSTRLYLSRLQNYNMIVESKIIKNEKTVEKVYKLTTTKLEIINSQTNSNISEKTKQEECNSMAEYFNKLTSNAIGNIYKYTDSPYIIKSCFISANTEKMAAFKEKLNALIDEFNEMEDVDEEKTYGLIVNFTPYELD